MLDRIIALDTKLFLWINSLNSPFWDKLMWLVSGKLEWIPLYLFLLIILFIRFRWKGLWVLLSIGILITLTDQISTEVFKNGFERLRPSHNPQINHLIHCVNDYRGGMYGFVSSHAANSFAIAVFFSLLIKKQWASVLLLLWATLVSYSRIYLGVHYPGDILGGAILGAILAFLVYYTLKFFYNKQSDPEKI